MIREGLSLNLLEALTCGPYVYFGSVLEYEHLIDALVEHLGALEYWRALPDGKAIGMHCKIGKQSACTARWESEWPIFVQVVVVGAAAGSDCGILILPKDAKCG